MMTIQDWSWVEIGILSFDLTGQWLVNDWSKYLAGQKWSKVVFCKKFFKWLFLVLGVICGCQKEVCIPQNNTFFGLNEENYWQLSSFAHLPQWKYLILVVFTNNSLTSQKGFAQSISQNFWLVNWPVSRSKFRSLLVMTFLPADAHPAKMMDGSRERERERRREGCGGGTVAVAGMCTE